MIKHFINKILLVVIILLLSFIMNSQNIKLLSPDSFKIKVQNKETDLFTLKNKNGCIAQFTNYGARWLSFWIKDKYGEWGDVILGFDKLIDFQTASEAYHGAIVGRVCGRINQGIFYLDGQAYHLANNDGFGEPLQNHLHGGINGFHKKIWNAKKGIDFTGDQFVEFTCDSPDGEEGYPGNLKVKVRYTLKQNNTLRIDYWGKTDKRTPINLTNHAFFNLGGKPEKSVLNHLLTINSKEYIECDKNLIPTGRIKPLKNTPIDYTKTMCVGKNFSQDFPEIKKDKGIAIAYVINSSNNSVDSLKWGAKLKDPESGRVLTIYTNQPSLQIYNAWLMNGTDIGKNYTPYNSSAGIAIEPQGFPDAPNHNNFPSIIIDKGAIYHHISEYKFNIE